MLHFRDIRLNVLQVACYKLMLYYVSKLHVEVHDRVISYMMKLYVTCL